MQFTFLDERWLPQSVLCLRDYSLNKFLRDLVAGITVGLVALPLAMAFSIASGLTPQAGIYCAIVTVETAGKTHDTERVSFGVRSVAFDADKGFFLTANP